MARRITRLVMDAARYPIERALEIGKTLGLAALPDMVEQTGGKIILRTAADTGLPGDLVELLDGIQGALEPEVRSLVGIVRRDAGASSPEVGGWASFRSKDRHRELVLPESMQARLKTFMTHPVMLLGHNSRADDEMPIGSFKDVKVKDNGLEVLGELMAEHPKFKLILAALERGLLMWSIGFIPVKGRRPTSDELRAYGEDLEFVWEEIELLEISLVTIGSNREALAHLREIQLSYAKRELVDAQFADILAEMAKMSASLSGVKRRTTPLTRAAAQEKVDAVMAHCSTFVQGLKTLLDELVAAAGAAEDPAEGDGKPGDGKPAAAGGAGNGGTPPPPPPKKDALGLIDEALAQARESANHEEA